jgi:aspartyl-tRNA(Asn)/glutamyl-tRNA(Gln) amidotransferase subunit A
MASFPPPGTPAQGTPRADLVATRQRLRAGLTSAPAELERSIGLAQGPACASAFLRTMFDEARLAVEKTDPDQPLAGLAVSVKDLFDIAGQATPAGSTFLRDAAPAAQDAPPVARLRAAGGVILGRTNMTEFAYSGVGINPHFGTPVNPACAALDPQPRVPGGSSSGAAVSVACGAVFAGLGSDTGGSLRIPAALNGIVGFKPTARSVPTDGALPLSTSLDTVGALTRSVRDAALVHGVLSGRPVTPGGGALRDLHLAVPQTTFLDGADATVIAAFGRSLQRLRDAGAQVQEIALPQTAQMASLQAGGGLAAAESHAWHRALLERHTDAYDPRVLSRILRGAGISAADYLDLLAARRAWIAGMEVALQGFDALLSPTVPIVAPTLASLAPGEARDDEFFHVNGLLLRNTSVVNLLDGCAISLPCQAQGELPVGLMLWHAGGHDDAVLDAARLIEPLLQN